MIRIVESMMNQLHYFAEQLTSTSGYTALFKGGVVLLTVCAISIQQVSTIVIPLETSAYELKFKVEQAFKKKFESIEGLECDISHESYSNCRLSKHKKKLASNSFDTLDSELRFLFSLSIIMLIFSLAGFLFHPRYHKKRKDYPTIKT